MDNPAARVGGETLITDRLSVVVVNRTELGKEGGERALYPSSLYGGFEVNFDESHGTRS